MGKEKTDKNKTGMGIPIEWYFPEGVMTPFATNMVVQIMDNEFKLSFFEVKPPFRLDESETPPDKVRADCVGSVIVTADRLPKFIKVLQDQLDKYNLRKQTDNNTIN